ncbi:MAG: ATP-binding protein [Patescibacteria group bacterium]|nr:ATP-binding protein [Patescibacteria group bacterium]
MKFINSEDYKKIFTFNPSTPNRITARESGWLEFKESFNWLSKQGYTKSMAAFANNKGGYIVFGVKNNPKELVGLQSNNFEATDEEKITSYLNSCFSPEIEYEKFIVNVKSKTVGIVRIHQNRDKPVVCIKNDGELKESDIYYRYSGKSERIKYPELKALLEKLKETERKSWMEHLEKISKVGANNAAILDVLNGEISGEGGTLVIDRKLIPKLRFISSGSLQESGKPVLKLIGDVKPVSVVTSKNGTKLIRGTGFQITDNPKAPIIRLEELDILKKYPLNYRTLAKKLSGRYTDFKQNKKFNDLKKKLLGNKKFSLTRRLDPSNPKSTSQTFYSYSVYKEFDKHYKKR